MQTDVYRCLGGVIVGNHGHGLVGLLNLGHLHADESGGQMVLNDGLNRLGCFAVDGRTWWGFGHADMAGVGHEAHQNVLQ